MALASPVDSPQRRVGCRSHRRCVARSALGAPSGTITAAVNAVLARTPHGDSGPTSAAVHRRETGGAARRCSGRTRLRQEPRRVASRDLPPRGVVSRAAPTDTPRSPSGAVRRFDATSEGLRSRGKPPKDRVSGPLSDVTAPLRGVASRRGHRPDKWDPTADLAEPKNRCDDFSKTAPGKVD